MPSEVQALTALALALDHLTPYERQVALDFEDVLVLRHATAEEIAYRIDQQRKDAAPHGLCPFCGEPLTRSADSLEPIEFWGAKGTHVCRGGLGCEECGVPVERGVA